MYNHNYRFPKTPCQKCNAHHAIFLVFFRGFRDILMHSCRLELQCYLCYLSRCFWFCRYLHCFHSLICHRVISFQTWCYHPTSEMTHYRRMAQYLLPSPLLSPYVIRYSYRIFQFLVEILSLWVKLFWRSRWKLIVMASVVFSGRQFLSLTVDIFHQCIERNSFSMMLLYDVTHIVVSGFIDVSCRYIFLYILWSFSPPYYVWVDHHIQIYQ